MGFDNSKRVAISWYLSPSAGACNTVVFALGNPTYIANHSVSPYSARPGDVEERNASNATATFVRLDGKQICLTNSHVVRAFFQRKRFDPSVVFSIGNCRIDPDSVLIAESPESELELAVLNLDGCSIDELGVEGEVPTTFFEANSGSDGSLPYPGGLVILGGYPGILRHETSPNAVEFQTLGSSGSVVHEARFDNVVCRLKPDDCELDPPGSELVGDLGGMSGGPVFREVEIDGHTSIQNVGFIYEYSAAIDAFYVVKSQ